MTRFVLGIDRDESLTLDAKAVNRDGLAKEWRRLAERVREKSKSDGQRLDPKEGLPAVIMIWAADETPYSLVYALCWEAQQQGFQQWLFVRKSLQPDPSLIPPPGSVVRAQPSQLQEVLRTIPIRLHANDQGDIDHLSLGEIKFLDFKALRFELGTIQDEPDTPFDRSLLRIDSKLKFSELVRVTDLLAKFRITTIGFVEMRPGDDD